MFLKNAWYIAGWDYEIGRGLTRRIILNEAVVLYRKEDGIAVALEDACPHRKLPLSMGVLIGDTVQCGYHGLRFNCSGACVEVPGTDRIPPKAVVRNYPIIERWGLVWIWMGDPEQANESKLIDIPHYDDSAWGINRGAAMDINCDYRYMTDNLVDPSHVTYVHKTSLGNEDCDGVPVETTVDGNTVIASRWIKGCSLAPFFQPYVKFEGKADRLQHYEVRLPSSAVIKDIISPANTGAPEGKLHSDTFLLDSYNFLTPVTEESCRYYWFQVRNFDADCEETTESLNQAFCGAFNEDIVVMEAVQQGMQHKVTDNIDLSIDVGSLRGRRILDDMIRKEQGAV